MYLIRVRQIFHILKLAFCGLISLAATAGGLDLMIQSDGSGLEIPMELLNDTPFSSYFVPGLSLFLLIGVYGWITLYFEWKQKASTLFHFKGFACILILWLVLELWINPDFYMPSMHISLFAMGIILFALPSKRKKVA